MKQMVVQKTSIFPAGRVFVFQKLQQLKTLQIIAKPYAAFEPFSSGCGQTLSMHTGRGSIFFTIRRAVCF